jgi:hypothetical protein
MKKYEINISDHIHSQFRDLVDYFMYKYSLSEEDIIKIMKCLTEFFEKLAKEKETK